MLRITAPPKPYLQASLAAATPGQDEHNSVCVCAHCLLYSKPPPHPHPLLPDIDQLPPRCTAAHKHILCTPVCWVMLTGHAGRRYESVVISSRWGVPGPERFVYPGCVMHPRQLFASAVRCCFFLRCSQPFFFLPPHTAGSSSLDKNLPKNCRLN